MKRYFLLLILFVLSYTARPQGKIVFGSSPMSTADANEISMNKLLRRSHHLGSIKSDTLADSVLLALVVADKPGYLTYCIVYKEDTTHIVYEIEKYVGKATFAITTYWKNRNKKRRAEYDANLKLSGKYEEYFQNGWSKVSGYYRHGMQNGKWKFYSAKGELNTIEHYDNGVLVPNSRLK